MRPLVVVVLVALGLGAFLLLRDGADRGAAAHRGSPTEARASAEGSEVVPATLLEGRPSRRASKDARDESQPAGSADESQAESTSPATETETAAAALIQRIQREVEPDAWREDGGGAMKVMGGSNLVVKAPRPVQEAVEEFLEGLREEALARVLGEIPGGSEPAEPADREGGEAALRELLRGMLAQWKRLEAALRARTESRIPDALPLLEEVLSREPDHTVAAAYRKALLDTPPADPKVVDFHVDPGGLEQIRSPYDDVEWRVRELAPSRLSTWVLRWPSRTTFAALDRARRRARMDRWTIPGEERDRRLARAAPSVRLEGLDLFEAVQRLSVETLIDLEVDPPAHPWLTPKVLGRLAPTDGSLAALLQAVAASIGPGLRFTTYARVLLLIDVNHVPQMQGLEVRVFNVVDLLGADTAR